MTCRCGDKMRDGKDKAGHPIKWCYTCGQTIELAYLDFDKGIVFPSKKGSK